ncbi:DUF368 domain-containing protein [Reichenbachiella agarivorans]|uniref:DUF368 domain-containing protein n=1 Tax=Reichenbachiella agarivorans TaxID=2979464 RepID=A0ABY6CR14_9BACT|nr:DUF368 domain-containing protein [Reichenbachiella agarivorans]UXP31813.1 DUF368 domain-containing protein [Reichenbachiella agarivorans]
MKSFKDYLLLFLKGIGMGSADVVPGVSGGTIALITGVYGQLLDSINSFDLTALQLLRKMKFKKLWQHINGSFLLPLLGGIIVSIVTLAKVISHLLASNPIEIWSFFFGLIIISSISVLKEIKEWNYKVVGSCVLGIVIAYVITTITPATTPNQLWFVFISGAIAICAMILPGISGSFILLILGKYAYIVKSLNELNIAVVLVFVTGCITGLLSFSRAISWSLKKFHNYAIALLAGFMLGSLNKIWPWKKAIRFDWVDGKQIPTFEKNILPTEYFTETGQQPLIIHAILFMALGFLLVIIIEKLALLIKEPTDKNTAS